MKIFASEQKFWDVKVHFCQCDRPKTWFKKADHNKWHESAGIYALGSISAWFG
jgi:hypothetical protein